MRLGERARRGLVATAFALCAACLFAAPVSIAFVAPDEEPRYTSLLLGLRQGLKASGIGADGVIIVEHRVQRGDAAKARSVAEALRAGDARLAFVVGTELTRSVRMGASVLPIVFITPDDPVRAGVANSLARPDNNLTSMAFEFAELSAKRLELAKEVTPSARRIAVVFDRHDNSPLQGLAAARAAAARLGLQLVELDVEAVARSLNLAALAGKLDGLILVPGGAISTVTKAALELAAAAGGRSD